MKKFITHMLRRADARFVSYEAVDNQLLHYGNEDQPPKPTAFPILPVINGYAESGDEIGVYVFSEEYEKYPCCETNCKIFCEEVEQLCAEKGVTLHGGKVQVIFISDDDGVASQVDTFQKIVECFEEDDELYACISFSTKPSEMAELMALRYAKMAFKNVYIGCVAYGAFNFDTGVGKIYDETALVQLDDIVRILAQNGDPCPKETIKKILKM